MTKLVNWLAALCTFLSIWLALFYTFVRNDVSDTYKDVLYALPVLTVIGFVAYSGGTVLWKVYNFNDCNKEAIELQREIQEARKDLSAKGFKFN